MNLLELNGAHMVLCSPNDIAKKHRLSLVLGLFSLATNISLALMPNGRLSLVTVGREDRRGPTTTYVFCNIIWAYVIYIISNLKYNQVVLHNNCVSGRSRAVFSGVFVVCVIGVEIKFCVKR